MPEIRLNNHKKSTHNLRLLFIYMTLHICLWKFFFSTSIQSSCRLTAFIAKELTESRDIINVKDSYIQESMSYLISKQKSNGAWDDPNRLYDRGMKV